MNCMQQWCCCQAGSCHHSQQGLLAAVGRLTMCATACHLVINGRLRLPPGQMEPLLAVGTSEVLGEDSPCTGRVLLFEVRRPEGAGADSDEWQATRRYSRCTQALPVVLLCHFWCLLAQACPFPPAATNRGHGCRTYRDPVTQISITEAHLVYDHTLLQDIQGCCHPIFHCWSPPMFTSAAGSSGALSPSCPPSRATWWLQPATAWRPTRGQARACR